MNTKEAWTPEHGAGRQKDRALPFAPCPPLAPSYHQLVAPARRGIFTARQWLLDERRADGTWLGTRHGGASLPSQLILLLAYRGREETQLVRQAAEAILQQQQSTGGWSAVPDGPVDVSTSVQAYFALKLAGHTASDDRLSLARQRIRELGGADAADAATRFFLALLGQVEYDHCPPPVSGRLAARLAIVSQHRPVRDVELRRGVRELFLAKPCDWPTTGEEQGARSEQLPIAGKNTVGSMELVDILEFEELVWQIVALDAMGFDSGSPELAASEARLRELIVVDHDQDLAQPQPGMWPTIDTALAVRALRDSGLEPHDAVLSEALAALRCKSAIEQRDAGELAWLLEALAAVEPATATSGAALPPCIHVAGGRSGSFAISRLRQESLCEDAEAVTKRIVKRLCDLQNDDGSWGGAAPDVTGAVLEALSHHGLRLGQPAVDRAVAWLRDAQQADGSWESTAGVRLIHGTSLAVRGLVAAGVTADDFAVAAGVNWLLAQQQASGGWGETLEAADQRLFSSGPATATQTAWALLALLAAGEANGDAARRGVQFLLDTQEEDGRWDEPHFTARRSADSTWHRSELHSVVWPLLALSRWAVLAAAHQSEEPGRPALSLVVGP